MPSESRMGWYKYFVICLDSLFLSDYSPKEIYPHAPRTKPSDVRFKRLCGPSWRTGAERCSPVTLWMLDTKTSSTLIFIVEVCDRLHNAPHLALS